MGLFAALFEQVRKSSGRTDFEQEAPSLTPTPVARAMRDSAAFRPQGQALALEPRVMFDGAAASATTDPQHAGDTTRPAEAPTTARSTDNPASAQRAEATTTPAAPTASAAGEPTLPPQHLLVIDSRVEERELLSAQAQPGVTVLVVDMQQDGLAAITNALAQMGQVDSIQILSHGAAGQFTLGSRTVSADNVDQLSALLQGWQSHLTADADIQLYGCSVGAGQAGQTLVNELARWTGADVGASSDDTGAAAKGGDWTLETRVGDVDQALALSAEAVAAYDGLLADASPTVTLSSGGDDVLLGDTFTFTASFTNPSTQVGYAPYIDLFIPSTGKDGAGAEVDDGITFVSATFQGVQIQTFELIFDANGQARHPLAKGTDGQPLILNAADFGLRAGDRLWVLQLPNASITSGQPPIDIVVTLRLSNLADTSLTDGAPNLTVKARGGFQFGNTSADDPTADPTLIEAGTHDFVVHPTMVELTTTTNVPDEETVTGPNYSRSIIVTAATASDQTLTNVVIEQDLPNTIIVTSIVPGANGAVTSITLQDGTVITDAGTIATTLAAGAYLRHYEITYSTLTGSQNTTVNFYVPEVDSNGVSVLNPSTGAPRSITIAAPDASAQWTPLDTRDVPLDPDAVLSGSGNPATFAVLPMVVYKTPTITTDTGTAGASPGDTLTYTLNVQISDYFAFGRNVLNQGSLVITDVATDGQTLVPGSGRFVVNINGQQFTMVITPTVVENANGTTTLTLDIAQTLRDNQQALAALVGDLAFDDVINGATTAVISYQMTIDQFYGPPNDQSAINEGDTVGNNATITGTVLVDRANIGGTATDVDRSTVTIGTNQVDIDILTVDGTDVSADPAVELRPGDVVTFQVSYDLVTGDYENFSLRVYMPLPLFDVNGITWTVGQGNNQWFTGPGHSMLDTVQSVTSVVDGNYIVFDFGDHSSLLNSGGRVELRFTMTVSDTPFGDNRKVTVIAQSDQVTTVGGEHIISQDAAVIDSIAEPVLSISHGVVSSSNGTVTGAGDNDWALPGDTSVPPFTAPVTEITDVNGNVSGIDGGDTLRMATAIENSGGGDAYDVSTRIDLPAGLDFAGGSLAATLRVYRGDGTLLVAGTDYRVVGNVVTFLDPVEAHGSLLAGRPGTAADINGENVIILLYEARVSDTIAASSTLETSAVLTNYASVDNGEDFTPVDLTDLAGQQVAAPAVIKVYRDGTLTENDSSATHTTGANLVVGETMDYDIVVTLPEGTTANLRIDDLIPAGLALDTSFNGGLGYEVILLQSGSGALTADFAGTVTGQTATGIGGTVGQDGVDARLSFTASVNGADNNLGNNSFVIRVRLVASNAIDNQAGRTLNNSAQLVYQDPDGDVAGGTALDRTVALTGGTPSVAVVEPTLTVTQTVDGIPPLGVDEGDSLNYTITIGNTSGTDAFDLSFVETFPTAGNVPTALLSGMTLVSVTYTAADGSTRDGTADFELVNGVLRNVAGANIDLANGARITIVVSAVVTADAVNLQTIDSTANVQWTSLNDTVPVTSAGGERTGVDGLLNSGVLNDYQAQTLTRVPVLSGVQLSRIGGMADTPPADGGTDGANEQVAVGEVVRYRVVSAIGEGLTTEYLVQVVLDQGLTFVNDGTIKIAIVSDGGVTTELLLHTDGTLTVLGDRSSAIAQPITADLSGQAPDATINPLRVIVSTDAQGRTVINFSLGNITNSDADDNLEGVVIEFNARVANVATNTAGTALAATASFIRSGGVVGATDTVTDTVAEPAFSGMVKQVDSFTPNTDNIPGTPDGTTSTANVSVSFTQSGNAPAYDVRFVDHFDGVTSIDGFNPYTLTSVTINGETILPADFFLRGISAVVDATGVRLAVEKVDAGTTVVVNYSVVVDANTAYANTDAVLTWSSLPEGFTAWGGTAVGADGTADGERDGSETGPNTYVLREGAGLGLINGTLWDDSLSATTSSTPDGALLAGQTVTLRWAGADGALDTGDDQLFTTVTDSGGFFHFSALAAGSYRVEAPTPVTLADPTGALRVRIDSDAAALGQVVSAIGEGSADDASFGYVQINDAPVNTVPGAQTVNEDTLLNIPPLSVADVDLNNGLAAGVLDVTLTVLHGTLNFTAAPAGGLTVGGQGTATITLSGTAADINAVLATLTYQGVANFNGSDTLTITTRDRGGFGDADGDGTPGETTEDQLQDVDTVAITVVPVNDIPQAVGESVIAVEAGGTNNGTAGVDPSGDLLANDIDVDIATNGDVLHLTSITFQGATFTFPAGDDSSTEHAIQGSFGTLYVRANGSARYVVDNDDPLVQSKRLAGDTLTEEFTYTLADSANAAAPAPATLTITIQGANDTPVGVDDAGAAVEAGGVNNGTAGSPAAGNVLTNDTDVDANGETKIVSGIRDVPKDQAGNLVAVVAGTGTVVVGQYGTLTINADGSYSYVVDDANAAVQALSTGASLQDIFSYELTDALGLSALANLTITINGAFDNPVASDDLAQAQAQGFDAGGNPIGAESNPSGNVITDASRPDGNPTPGTGVDSDIDTADQPNTELTINAARTGTELGGGVLGGLVNGSIVLVGTYGTLTLNSDGSFTYDVDSTNAAVRARQAGDPPLEDYFTYQILDHGDLTDTAQLRINIFGANDGPVAQNDNAFAVEAGGVNNGTPGVDPSGDVIVASVDPDGDPLTVIGIRTGAEADTGTAGTVGSPLQGLYGTLTVNADGTFTYVLDNNNAQVQALRTALDTLSERFTYTLSDGQGGTDLAEIIVRIDGRNDNPVAANDTGTIAEAGGANNSIPSVDAMGNVLLGNANGGADTDVDGGPGEPVDYGETQAVTAVEAGIEDPVAPAGGVGVELRGTYGWLTLNADGSYRYRLDNTMPEVEALRVSGNTLLDRFNYAVSDRAGATDVATLTITITGTNDNPVAQNDAGTAVEAGGVNNGTPGSPATGNVLANDTDVDQFGETQTVQSFLQGAANGTVGTAFAAQYGTLTLNANGTYTYAVNNDNATVQALQPGQTLTEVFTYTMVDAAGATATATLTITIQGADDAPMARDDAGTAVEQGGINNGSGGSNATGNVVLGDATGGVADGDIDNLGVALTVSGVRTGQEAGTGTVGTVGTALQGLYGTLTLNANGSYTYVVDNNNAAVQALRLSGNTLQDVFTYTVSDPGALSDTAQLTITIRGANDTPVAVDDRGGALEAGGVNNGTPGLDPRGNVLDNDSDVDLNGETRAVQGFAQGGTSGTVGTAFTAQYGTLTLNADGSWEYIVDNDNAAVQALRTNGDTLDEVFTYTVVDALGATSTANFTITIHGRDDTPVAMDDILTPQEAGGTFNGTPGVNPVGNLLANDIDVDGADPRTLIGIRRGTIDEAGTFTLVNGPRSIDGLFGTLSLDRNGSFIYVLNNSAAVVERLRAGDTLVENFTYETSDLFGAIDIAQVTVRIAGAWDAPVAVDDSNFAAAGTVRNPGQGVDAVGNVLSNDTDVDFPDTRTVTGIAAGQEAGNPTLTAVGTSFDIDGLYGTLTIHADGSYTYRVDVLNLAVQNLQPGQTLDEFFTYEVSDAGGLTDRAQLTIEVRGINNPPFTLPDQGDAVEAGGLNNGQPGVNPSGNVLANDLDLDGDTLAITGIRTGPLAGTGTDGAVGQVLRGQWGELTIHADGSWTYVVDNTLPEVQALRITGQTLEESFTYTVTDVLGDTDTGVLRIVVDGRNDTPVAQDDAAEAVEAGGIANGIPGTDAVGNVLDNDNDVDGVDKGEIEQVVRYQSANGALGEAGSVVVGLYGQIVINADGSYRYVIDNGNPAVQALRTSGETLTESFSYVMRDTAGAVSQANLVIVVRGADDNPVARDDSNVASDQVVAPNATGNVLPNDSDVDGGDSLRVIAIRAGEEAGTGASGSLGQSLAGRYGTLVINADGSYTYAIDMSNPEVLAAAGFGQVLQDVFTYTIADISGATDQAQLVIHLDISEPRVNEGPDPFFLGRGDLSERVFDLGFVPGIFVQPVVREDARVNAIERSSVDGSWVGLVLDPAMRGLPPSMAQGLGTVQGQYVGEVVRESALAAQLDLARFLGRHGRVSLSADGLLSDPSVFAPTGADLTDGPAQRAAPAETGARPARGADAGAAGEAPQKTADAFTQQLKQAAARLNSFEIQ